MLTRSYNRSPSQMRPIKITTKYLKNPAGSVLCEYGETKVLCTASIEEMVPNWMRSQRKSGGWVTGEYSLLPGSTHERSRRERMHVSGRTLEIQRLIGRVLRGVVDLKLLGERTIVIDCDVLQADGGTRTAAITGGYVALKLAIEHLLKNNKIRSNPLQDSVAALSLGLLEDEIFLDLDYEEDQKADVDMNLVMTSSGKILEIQGTAEKKPFQTEHLLKMLSMAQPAFQEIFDEQNSAMA